MRLALYDHDKKKDSRIGKVDVELKGGSVMGSGNASSSTSTSTNASVRAGSAFAAEDGNGGHGSGGRVAKWPMPVHDSPELTLGFRWAISPPVFIEPQPETTPV